MKKLLLAAILALFACGMALGQQVLRVAAPDQKSPQVRSLQGFVLGSDDSPLVNAIVYLKNTKTLAVKTFISEKDGGYRFNALSPNVDYEVYAEYQGKKSGTKTLSSFDSRKQATINLKIATK